MREAVPAIKAMLRDVVIEVCVRAAATLGEIGPAANGAVSELGESLKNAEDSSLRRYVASALGKIGTEDAITALIDALSDTNKNVRIEVSLALGGLGKKAKEAAPKLIGALTDSDESVRSATVIALGKIAVETADAKIVIPHLTSALKDEKTGVRKDVVDALCSIADEVSNAGSTEILPQLEAVHKAVKEHRDPRVKARADVIKRDVDRLESLQQRGPIEKVVQLIQGYPTFSFIVGVFLLYLSLPICWLLLLLLRPLWLLKISTFLSSYKPKFSLLGDVTLDARVFLLVSPVHFHPRVLDAFVQKHRDSVKRNFASMVTGRRRKVYVTTPAMIGEELWDGSSATQLQPIFDKSRVTVLITGKTGEGKTNLAYQMAFWAMDEREEMRLCKHQMLPVLIKADMKPHLDSKETFREAIRGHLEDTIGRSGDISEELLAQLLLQRRVLVIVDGLSESDDSTSKSIHPAQADFPVAALIVTSRSDKELEHVVKTTIRPRGLARILKVAAWECLRRSYRPSHVRRADILEALSEETDHASLLKDLEDQLHVIEAVSDDQIQFSFALQAESLAGSYLVEQHGNRESEWHNFFVEVEKQHGAPGTIRGFLLAMHDSCLRYGDNYGVPGWVLEKLGQLVVPASASPSSHSK